MKTRKLLTVLAAAILGVGIAQAADTAFTYQGELKQNGMPVDGSFAMDFSLWSESEDGSQIGATVNRPGVAVSGGLFSVELDFGGSSLGNGSSDRWLEIVVAGTTLSPRQRITASPFSISTRGIVVDDSLNVGIGTDSPQTKLHVRGDAAAVRIQDDDDGDSYTTIADVQPSQLLIQKVSRDEQGCNIDIDPVPPDDSDAYAAIRFLRHTNVNGPKYVAFHRGNNTTQTSAVVGVDGADSYFQANGGNVGIGTTTPSAKLDVVNTGSARAARIVNNNPASDLTTMRVDTNSTNPDVAALAGVNTGNGPAVIAQTGGTSGPALRVQQADNTLNIRANAIDTAGGGTFGDPLYLNRDSTNVVAIGMGGGRCGIGTDLPSAKLHLVSETAGSGNNTAMFQAPNIGPRASHIHYGTTGDWYIRSARDDGKVILQDYGGKIEFGQYGMHPALAYGKINEDGTIVSVSDNVQSVSHFAAGSYLIAIAGGFNDSDVMLVTPQHGNRTAAAALYFDNQRMYVLIYEADNDVDNAPFNFVVYRP